MLVLCQVNQHQRCVSLPLRLAQRGTQKPIEGHMHRIFLLGLLWLLMPLPAHGWVCESKTDNYPRWSVLEQGKYLGEDWLLVTRRNPMKREELEMGPGRARKIRGGDEPVFEVMFDGKIEVLYCEERRSLRSD